MRDPVAQLLAAAALQRSAAASKAGCCIPEAHVVYQALTRGW